MNNHNEYQTAGSVPSHCVCIADSTPRNGKCFTVCSGKPKFSLAVEGAEKPESEQDMKEYLLYMEKKILFLEKKLSDLEHLFFFRNQPGIAEHGRPC